MYPDAVDPLAASSATSIGRYRVLGRLGEGGMGEVLRARDDKLGRDVAIKRVKNVFGVMAESFHARFEAEARALAALQHAGVVQIYDLGADADGPYLVMELVDGPSLSALLKERGPLPPAQVRSLGIQLSRALEAAHARGILHRDVKPANVLLAPGGVWKLADFGVARMPDSEMTSAGLFIGTPTYAAPEALTQAHFSAASDVFGLAATLVESATGKKPRPEATLAALIVSASSPLELAEVPAELLAPLRAALAADAERRPSAAQLAELLAGGEPEDWESPPAGTSSVAEGPPGLAAVGPAPATVQLRPGADPGPSARAAAGEPSGIRTVPPAEHTIHVADATQAPATHGAAVPVSMAYGAQPRLAPATHGAAQPVAVPYGAQPGPVPAPEAARPLDVRRWGRVAAAAAAGVLALWLITRCSDSGQPASGVPGGWPASPSASDPSHGVDYFSMPSGLDGRGQKAWADVAYAVNDGALRKAADKLRKFEQRFGVSEESTRLRRWLEQQDLSAED